MPQELRQIKVHLPEPTRVGEIPLMGRHIFKAYDAPVLKDVSLSLYRGERMILLGPNGVGKSTLIKILMNKLTPDSGEIVYDDNCHLGYYSQEFETFDEQKTLVEMINDQSSLPEHIIRPFLARFLFPGQKVFQKINTLSGGEKTRLAIATLLLKNYNTLILDEPTTYLDVMSQRIILEALKEYKGTMLVVSHTPEFIKELAPKRALLLPENQILPWSEELYNKISEI
jgi:ATP-binding cassette subfamily F protein 3